MWLNRSFQFKFTLQRACFTFVALLTTPWIIFYMALKLLWEKKSNGTHEQESLADSLFWRAELKGSFFTLMAWIAEVPVYIFDLSPIGSPISRMWRTPIRIHSKKSHTRSTTT